MLIMNYIKDVYNKIKQLQFRDKLISRIILGSRKYKNINII